MPIVVKEINLRAGNRLRQARTSEIAKLWLAVADNQDAFEYFYKGLSIVRIYVPGNPTKNESKGMRPYIWGDSSDRKLTPFYTSLNEMAVGLLTRGSFKQSNIRYGIMPFSEFLSFLHELGRSTCMNPGCASERPFSFAEVESLMLEYGQPIASANNPQVKNNIKTKEKNQTGETPTPIQPMPEEPLPKAVMDYGAWLTEGEISVLLKVKLSSVRRHLKIILNTPCLVGSPASFNSRYSLEVVYHVARSLKGLLVNSQSDLLKFSFLTGQSVSLPPPPRPTVLVDNSKIFELEKENKQLKRELDKKELALSRAKAKASEKIDKALKFHLDESVRLKDEIESLRLKLRNMAADLSIPTSLSEVISLADQYFSGSLEILPEARSSAAEYAYATDSKIIVEAWNMMAALGGPLYEMKFNEENFSIDSFQAKTGFELALREGKKTKKDKALEASRVFLYNGSLITAYPHLKSKIRDSFRLYFHILDNERKILICHLGRHLPTSKNKS